MKNGVVLAFILLVFLIAVAYYVGTTQVGLAGAKAFQQGVYALTGRTAIGNFAAYPSGGGTAPSVTF